MKKGTFLIAIIIIFLCSCDKEKNGNENLFILTDKITYTSNEKVKINITNNFENIIDYYICSSYKGIPPSILKYENDDWTGFWGPICDGFTSHCCGELEPQISYNDTLNVEFEKGKYKIEYSFIVEDGVGYQSFYSNEFAVD